MTSAARAGPWRGAVSLRWQVRALVLVSMVWVAGLGVAIHRAETGRAISDAVAQSLGDRMVQIQAAIASGNAPPVGHEGGRLSWRVLVVDAFSLSVRRNWSETVFRLGPASGPQTLVRVALAKSALDPQARFGGEGLAEQLNALSRRIVALGSEATLRMQTADGGWIEFASPDHWRARPTRIELGLLVLIGLALVLAPVWWLSTRLSERVGRLAGYARDLLLARAVDPVPVAGPAELVELAEALNNVNTDLKRQIAARTRFLAAISHDLRTPATRMKLRAELIQDPALRTKMLADLQEISDMVTASLGFMRDGLDDTEEETILFPSLLQSMCDDYSDVGEQVTLHLPDPLIATTPGTVFDPRSKQISVNVTRRLTLRCQPARLRRAFGNLIDNSLKYGGWARVVIDADADEIVVRIIDGGPGIAEAQQGLVFDPFYRVEGSRSRNTGGVGLGLSVAKSIVEAHGGSIALFNHPSQGLEVQVRLPRTA